MIRRIQVLIFICLANIAHSYVDLWVQPGLNGYSDGFGWNADAGLRADIRQFAPGFPGGPFLGLGVFVSGVPAAFSNLTVLSVAGGLEAGFDFFRSGSRWSLSSSCLAGAGYLQLVNQYTNADRAGFYVAPAVRFSAPVLPFLLLGADVSCRMTFIDLLTDPYIHQTLNFSLALTFAPADREARGPKPVIRGNTGAGLAENIRAVVREENLPGTVTEESGGVMLSISDVLFDVNSNGVRSEYGEALAALARRVGAYPKLVVSVEGHTDDTGNADFNRALSGRRAQNVAAILVRWGIPEGRISSTGYGQTRPAAPNTSPANRARNRRVEIRFREGR